jgi:DNA-binding HxlR family transcriptional regulator
LVKRPVHSGARRLEYRVTGKGEALRPALKLIEGWGNGASVALQDNAAQVGLEPI